MGPDIHWGATFKYLALRSAIAAPLLWAVVAIDESRTDPLWEMAFVLPIGLFVVGLFGLFSVYLVAIRAPLAWLVHWATGPVLALPLLADPVIWVLSHLWPRAVPIVLPPFLNAWQWLVLADEVPRPSRRA